MSIIKPLQNGLDNIFNRLTYTLADIPSNTMLPNSVLVKASRIPSIVRYQRTKLIQSQIVVIAAFFALVTILWSVVDFLAFPTEVQYKLFLGRCIVSVAFLIVFITTSRIEREILIISMIGIMIGIITLFYFFCRPFGMEESQSFFGNVVLTGYEFVPFIIFSGLGFFPLTLTESLFFIITLLAIYCLGELRIPFHHMLTFELGSLWIMLLLGAISMLISLHQLKLFIMQVDIAAHDRLTGGVSRLYGNGLLEAFWSISIRHASPFSIAFLDLDHFKKVNDTFGHNAGDDILCTAVRRMRAAIRKSDFIIRWGGEEFLILMPNTDLNGATQVIAHLYATGFGMKPDNTPQTISTGIAERMHDKASTLSALIDIADKRLYMAKSSGRNRYIRSDL